APMSFMTDRPLSAREFLDECLAFKKAHPVQSRFFSVFLEGKLPPEQLRLWAKDMYHYIQPAIPALTAWLSHAPTLIERATASRAARWHSTSCTSRPRRSTAATPRPPLSPSRARASSRRSSAAPSSGRCSRTRGCRPASTPSCRVD